MLTPGRRQLCQASRDKPSTIMSIKRRNGAGSDSPLFVLVIRKTLNQRSFLIGALSQSPGDRIAWFRVCKRSWSSTAIAGHQPLVHLKFFVGMLDEDRRDDAKGRLAGDHQPSYRRCSSPRGRA